MKLCYEKKKLIQLVIKQAGLISVKWFPMRYNLISQEAEDIDPFGASGSYVQIRADPTAAGRDGKPPREKNRSDGGRSRAETGREDFGAEDGGEQQIEGGKGTREAVNRINDAP